MSRKDGKLKVNERRVVPLLIALIIVLSISCDIFTVPRFKFLDVPFFSQWYNGWCGAACVQMWALYDGTLHHQDAIADFIGWNGSDPYAIAQGVDRFTNEVGIDYYFGPGDYQQDTAIASQTASVRDNIPSISIINEGRHTVIIIGFHWTNMATGPRADEILYHDPIVGPKIYETAARWKRYFFTPNPRDGQYAIVLGYRRYYTQGQSGYAEFLRRHGTYLGGPKNYGPKGPEG